MLETSPADIRAELESAWRATSLARSTGWLVLVHAALDVGTAFGGAAMRAAGARADGVIAEADAAFASLVTRLLNAGAGAVVLEWLHDQATIERGR